MSELLDRQAVLAWADAAVLALTTARPLINAANVFPVADSDTGTNLLLTVREGARSARSVGHDLADGPGEHTMRAFARGALLGARGNSGIIMSEYLRGFADGLGSCDGDPPRDLAHCLTRAAWSAYAAVADPVQGTMLTAADAAARAAGRAAAAITEGGDAPAGPALEHTARAACAGAARALARSPADLDVLAENGVLDAGAYGLVLVLDALGQALLHAPAGAMAAQLSTLRLLRPALAPDDGSGAPAPGAALLAGAASGRELDRELAAQREHGSLADPTGAVDGEFEVMFVLESTPEQRPHEADLAEGLRSRLRAVGRSVVVVGGDGVWQAHVHTDDVAAALDTVRRAHMRQVCVRHLPGLVSASAWGQEDESAAEEPSSGVVAGVAGPALAAELARTGAVVLLTASPWAPGEVQRAVEDAGTDDVVVLAPVGECARAARRAAQSSDARIEVVEVAGDLQTVVAATVAATTEAAAGGSLHELAQEMRAAAAGVRTLAPAEHEPGREAERCVERIARAVGTGPGPEQVLALHGTGVIEAERTALVDAVHVRWPRADVVLVASGLPGGWGEVGW
ncbi:MAG: DAK2 domain-containing protein [Cellulomonadaceae bacterium]